ncbi:hypothetical protein LTR16_001016 [Cryomyces antarcticus]|uniref:Uncharacterized protein n=1 Tax=Cryomyces antarcticus TaxID=329879 RepID=A0ABR0LZX9_9PEZI|nr:hypothetical protein LTR16_001016 [Cryomyces antarcticus]
MPEINDEPLFEAWYLSEEEELSSVEEDDDTMSADSVEIVDLSNSSMMLPERLAESCSFVEQQCDMAVAVCMVSAGRAKVVSTCKPNIISVPLTPALKRGPTIIRPPTSKLSRWSLSYSDRSTRSSSVRSSSSTHSHMSAFSASTSSSPASPAKSSLRGLSRISIARMTAKRSVSANDAEAMRRPQTANTRPSSSPARNGMPKLIPRPANERAPPIELPPFPGDEVNDESDEWPRRVDSALPSATPSIRLGKLRPS